MYYKMTKEDYLNYDKKFKKTYIGKSIFLTTRILSIIFAILLVLPTIQSIIDHTKETFDYLYIAAMILTGVGAIISLFEYKIELKNYIIESSK